ncbi:class I SAM-dependent methyltransferase [Wolbachia endosymbiont of Dirofilaria (Dirofilaria) immitis]|uniref:class I SAM-dependent methyltransferase n=1 Tax=Wolbachia endosymbiont of Dirofilaria (Dirofilaria) immitis TaxID=1812115 RepID=UPI00158CB295|nr:SAM-dependent methyltransferase [Wolbachia endosymbiont of Dirofilaria (Dirofilaria) immitis]QKX02111.1 SAM-dependent methyltransferase [Wolbachia endosymbiont of Dirofilaria (Dirofilaria) immitis]
MLSYICKLIDKNRGSIPISDFMGAVLYHKKYGYYMSRSPLGKNGDFITAPEISQLFGEIIAVWVMYTWEKLGKPLKFSLVELGPGKGTLIYDIVRVTKKHSSFFRSMAIHLVEISPTLQRMQKEKLKELNIDWHIDVNNLPRQPTIFLANEFFDAFPIDQFIYHNGGWYENRVTRQDDKVSFQCLMLESRRKKSCIPVLATQVTNGKLFDGAVVEICSAGIKILKRLEEKIVNDGGAAIIIDYGYVYPTYKSTLQSIGQHKYSNFLENVGNNDITALVNFQALKSSLKYVDCEILTQREFLYLFGIKERVQVLMGNSDNEQKNRIFSEFLRLTENMGTLFKVMLINN